MNFFRERKSPSENIAFMAFAAALNAIFSVLLAFVPFSDLFVLLFLPLVSALVGLLCDKKYLPVYLLAAIGVSLASTAYDMQATFFYVIPAIFAGTLYGFLYHKDWPLPYVILGTALLELGLNYLALPIVQGIYGNDIIAFFLKVLSLDQHPYIGDIIPAFLLAYALAQTSISHLVIQAFFGRFHLLKEDNEKLCISYPLGGICVVILTITFAFFYPAVSYFFFVLSLYLSAFAALLFRQKYVWWVYLITGLMGLFALYGFAFLYRYVPKDGGLALLAFFLFALDGGALLGRLLLWKKEKEE